MSWLDRPVASLGLNLLCCNINTGGLPWNSGLDGGLDQEIDDKYTSWQLKSMPQGAAPPISDQTSAVRRVRLRPTVVHKLPVEQISARCLGWCIFWLVACLGYQRVPFWAHYFSWCMKTTCPAVRFSMGLALTYWLMISKFCHLSAGGPGLFTPLEHWLWQLQFNTATCKILHHDQQEILARTATHCYQQTSCLWSSYLPVKHCSLEKKNVYLTLYN